MESCCHPVLTCAEAQVLEAQVLRSPDEEWAAMQRAGKAIACAVLGDLREVGGLSSQPRLLVLVGKGHNGGDALIAAHAVLAAHPQASADVIFAFGEAALRPLTARAWQDLRDTGLPFRVLDVRGAAFFSAPYDIALDGIFGFQFRPPMDEATAELLARVNSHPSIRLRAAVDLPSGMVERASKTVFRADFSYATGSVKTPLLAPANQAQVGRIRYLDLGFFRTGEGNLTTEHGAVLLPSLLKPLSLLRPAQSDKRTYGHLVVVGGSRSYPGAILMTVQAALRSGVGLLTAFVPESLAPEYAARFPEAMWVGCPETSSGGLAAESLVLIQQRALRVTSLVVGPGLTAERECLELAASLVRQAQQPILLDADALRPEVVAAAEGKRVILTPHAGEWERLGGLDESAGGQAVPAQEMLAILKGYPTRLENIACRAEASLCSTPAPAYCFFGGPVLARGGSGDLLAGIIGGLLAQQPDNLWLAAARGVVWHGLAADLLARDQGQIAVQTTQLLDYLHPALRAEW
jgi:ADP-dependent NAD(P)H-hydrate dehydratase / NAD(P)H-hydrate epimerase